MVKKVVKTIKGDLLPASKVVNIFGNYYEKGKVNVKNSGDAFLINGRWRTNVVWNEALQKYVLPEAVPETKEGHVYGVVGPNMVKDFFPITDDIVEVENIIFQNKQVLELNNYDYTMYHNKRLFLNQNETNQFPFSHIDMSHAILHNGGKTQTYTSPFLKESSQTYSLSDLNEKKISQYLNSEFNKNSDIIFKKISKLIPYSLGLEFETSFGAIPEPLLSKTGLIPLKDGSISGYEYVTPPLRGVRKVDDIVRSCLHLSTFTGTNESCSLHVHFGDLPKSRSFIVALYELWHQLQEEVNYLNDVDKNSEKFILKKANAKNHCQKVPSLITRVNKNTREIINDTYKNIFKMFNGLHNPSFEYNRKNKTSVFKNLAKWNNNSRYYNLNLYNYFFSNSGTIEFRLHSGTVNVFKTLSYILILNAIVKYAENHINKILNPNYKITIKDVLYTIYGKKNPELFSHLYQYFNFRSHCFVLQHLLNSQNGPQKNYRYLCDFYPALDNLFVFKDNYNKHLLNYFVEDDDEWLTKLSYRNSAKLLSSFSKVLMVEVEKLKNQFDIKIPFFFPFPLVNEDFMKENEKNKEKEYFWLDQKEGEHKMFIPNDDDDPEVPEDIMWDMQIEEEEF